MAKAALLGGPPNWSWLESGREACMENFDFAVKYFSSEMLPQCLKGVVIQVPPATHFPL